MGIRIQIASVLSNLADPDSESYLQSSKSEKKTLDKLTKIHEEKRLKTDGQ